MTDEKTCGRVAVITGAASGIGEATARALSSDQIEETHRMIETNLLGAVTATEVVLDVNGWSEAVRQESEILIRPFKQAL